VACAITALWATMHMSIQAWACAAIESSRAFAPTASSDILSQGQDFGEDTKDKLGL
jgi:hypothetical protein